MINARAETVTDAFRPRRCLVSTDSYYEWQLRVRGGDNQLHHAHRRRALRLRRAVVPEAGAGRAEAPCPAMLATTTKTAPKSIEVIDDRMRVILDATGQNSWLDHKRPRDVLFALLVLVAAEHIADRQVSGRANDVRHDH